MTWRFDKEVAAMFPAHARSHIPNYEEVIELSVEVCRLYGSDAAIIDVGVATGETVSQLASAGFTNLFGVDNSQAMLDACPTDIAQLICSDTFPGDMKFDVVLMNWTLHFMTDKAAYLASVYDGLNPGGALVMSDKVSDDEFPTRFYHTFKRSAGLSDAEIEAKAQSLAGVMHLDPIDWYFDTLGRLGFQNINIVNAYWCFATFVAVKP